MFHNQVVSQRYPKKIIEQHCFIPVVQEDVPFSGWYLCVVGKSIPNSRQQWFWNPLRDRHAVQMPSRAAWNEGREEWAKPKATFTLDRPLMHSLKPIGPFVFFFLYSGIKHGKVILLAEDPPHTFLSMYVCSFIFYSSLRSLSLNTEYQSYPAKSSQVVLCAFSWCMILWFVGQWRVEQKWRLVLSQESDPLPLSTLEYHGDAMEYLVGNTCACHEARTLEGYGHGWT